MLRVSCHQAMNTDEFHLSALTGTSIKYSVSCLLNSFCRYARGPNEFDDNFGEAVDPVCVDSASDDCKTPKVDIPLSRNSWIDAEYTDDTINPKVRFYDVVVCSL